MDREQAIEIIERHSEYIVSGSLLEQALSMAIKELKAQLSQEGTTFDTISRQAAIDAVDAIGHIATMPDGDKCIRRSAVKYTLSMLPPAQPEPQEGHWIRRGCGLNIECKCSVCDYKDFVEPYDTYWFKRNYCPNCGAKMKGEPNERTD